MKIPNKSRPITFSFSITSILSSSLDFGDGLAPMELPSLKNRRAALAKRAGFGAVSEAA